MQKIAVVTGASKGIGRAIACQLAAKGYHVAAMARSQERLQALADEIEQQGGRCSVFPVDLADAASIPGAAGEILRVCGGVHVLVNNAGITADNLLLRMSLEEMEEVLAVNLLAPMLLSKALLRTMIKQRWGRIITISSVVALMGNPGQTNYAAAKSGLMGFARSLAREVGSRGVTVNVVAPGYIETEMTAGLDEATRAAFLRNIPLGHFGSADDIAHCVAFLAGPEANYITGQVLTVDGGLYM